MKQEPTKRSSRGNHRRFRAVRMSICDEHKKLQYFYDDVYDENGKRKKIDHAAVKKRLEELWTKKK